MPSNILKLRVPEEQELQLRAYAARSGRTLTDVLLDGASRVIEERDLRSQLVDSLIGLLSEGPADHTSATFVVRGTDVEVELAPDIGVPFGRGAEVVLVPAGDRRVALEVRAFAGDPELAGTVLPICTFPAGLNARVTVCLEDLDPDLW